MSRNLRGARLVASIVFGICLLAPAAALAQECAQASEIEPAMRAAIDGAALQYIQFAAHGDVQSLRQAAIPSLAASFDGIQQTVTHDKGILGEQVTIRRDYLLDATRATVSTASFTIPNLDPGRYALVLTNVGGGKSPYMVTVVLQNLQNQWRLAGYYPKVTEIAGHDAAWYVHEAKQFSQKGELHNAYLYYLVAWEVYSPVDFMSSLQLDKLANEIQQARPADIPAGEAVALAANGRTFNVTQMFAVPDDQGGLSLVVKYESADVGNTVQSFQDNMALIKALAGKLPELRGAFSGIVARATTRDGHDYGTLQVMKDIH